MRKLLPVAVILFTLLTHVGVTQTVTRGPYLQSLTPTSIKVKWRTDTATDSRVYYGTNSGNLTDFVDVTAPGTEHVVQLTNLQPYTTYYYSVGTTTQALSGPDALHYFKTAPVKGTEQPYRFWAIGDFGKNNQGQVDVMNSCITHTGSEHIDMWLWLGDCAYDNGTDVEYQTKVFDVYQDIMKYIPFYPAPGNHDYNSVCPIPCFEDPNSHSGPYYDIIEVPKNAEAGGVASGQELYYSFDYGNVHFLSLNSELGSLIAGYDWNGVYGSSNWNSSPARQWLIDDLTANTLPWVVVYFHQPPYTHGSHNSDDIIEIYMKAMRDNYTPIFEQFGVDIVLCGHSHVYERSFLMQGFHGSQYPNSSTFDKNVHVIDTSSGKFTLSEPYVKYTTGPNINKGSVFVVAGNAGSREQGASLTHPAMYYGDDGYGSFMMEVNGNKLDGKYLSSTGAVLDEFSIIKIPDAVLTIEHVSICGDETHFAGGAEQNTTGVYYDVLPGTGGDRDTMHATNLIVSPSIPEVAQQENLLSVPNVYDSYQWYRNDSAVQGATNASHLATVEGDYFVQVSDTGGCQAFSDTIAVTFIGIKKVVNTAEVQLYPNPVTDDIVIAFSSIIEGNVQIDIYSTIGKRVFTSAITEFNRDKEVISMKNLEAGNYLIRVSGKKIEFSGWVVKQ